MNYLPSLLRYIANNTSSSENNDTSLTNYLLLYL